MSSNKRGKNIYLIRHGSILQQGSERRYIGQSDLPLSRDGVWQSQLLHLNFKGKEISTAFCSDLVRSLDTACIICRGITDSVTIRPALREINMGTWEGKSFREIAQAHPGEYRQRGNDIANYRIPGAESFKECQDRILKAFFAIMESVEGNVLIVGHAGANRLLLCHLLGMPIENMFRIAQDYACINILAGTGDNYQVKLLNGTCRKE